jgi:hypothetical protein
MPLPRETGVPTHVTQVLPIAYTSATPAVAGQLVDYGGALAVNAATPIFGVLLEDATQGKTVSVAIAGLVEVLSGGVIGGVGNAIAADATGKAVAVGAGSQCLGRNRTAATAANQRIQILITREGTN